MWVSSNLDFRPEYETRLARTELPSLGAKNFVVLYFGTVYGTKSYRQYRKYECPLHLNDLNKV